MKDKPVFTAMSSEGIKFATDYELYYDDPKIKQVIY